MTRRPPVDTLGLVLVAAVHLASLPDCHGAKVVFKKANRLFWQLTLVWADSAYCGQLLDWVKQRCQYTLEIIKRPKQAKGFVLLPRRWVVERTFAWLGKCRRLSKDYEQSTRNSESFIHLAMIHLMLRRLAQHPHFFVP